MRNPPKSVTNSWPAPNYIDPQLQGASLEVIGITLITLSTIAVCLRLYVRVWILHTPGIDDWLIMISLVPGIGMTTSTLLGTEYGWGKHIWDSHPDWYRPSLLVSWISQLLFVVTVTLVKLSVCYSYQRLSDQKTFNMVIGISKVFILLWGVVFVVAVIFKCWVPSLYWTDPTHIKGMCTNEQYAMMVSSITNLLTDVWLVALPIPTLARLRLPFKQRLILIILMSLGFVACIAGIVRVYYLNRTLTTWDVTWEGYNAWVWTAIEVDLGIIASSIPPLRPLVRKHFPRLIGTNGSATFTGANGSGHPQRPDRDLPTAPGRVMSSILSSPRKATFQFEGRTYHRSEEDIELAGIFDRKREEDYKSDSVHNLT